LARGASRQSRTTEGKTQPMSHRTMICADP
jgi:hypothetical protein